MMVFMVFGTALLKAIDKSLQNQKRQQQPRPSTPPGSVEGTKCGGGHQPLQEAKRKVKTVMVVDIALVPSGSSVTLFAVITGFDTEVPLVMFCVPFTYMPLMWLAFNIQVHSGRSRACKRPLSPMNSRLLSPGSRPRPGTRSKLFFSRKQEQQVIPTEVPF